MKAAQLQRESRRQAVMRTIEDALLSGELRPGDRLVEATLAQRAGISRGPVREAVRQLVGEGVLVSYPSRGTFVARWTPQAVEEAYTLRATLERLAMREAAVRITPAQIAQLLAIVAEMQWSARGLDSRQLVRLDVRFHQQIYAASGHALLQRTLSRLRRQLYGLMGMDRGFASHYDDIAGDHRALVDLLRKGDVEAAGEAVAAHVLAAGAEVVAQVKEMLDE
jgi:DNA-binding GntR family transcriptional regulator